MNTPTACLARPTFSTPYMIGNMEESAEFFCTLRQKKVERLNKVSQDIKTLEAFLNDAGVDMEFSRQCHDEFDELLNVIFAWKKDSSGKFRLFVECADDFVDTDLDRPLIEVPYRKRIQLFFYLGEFITCLKYYLNNEELGELNDGQEL